MTGEKKTTKPKLSAKEKQTRAEARKQATLRRHEQKLALHQEQKEINNLIFSVKVLNSLSDLFLAELTKRLLRSVHSDAGQSQVAVIAREVSATTERALPKDWVLLEKLDVKALPRQQAEN